MNVGILSWMLDRKRTGVNNYLYNLIKNMVKNGKGNEIFLFHYKKSDDPLYSHVNDVIIPEMPFKLTSTIGLPKTIKNEDIDILHVPVHWYNQISPFLFNREIKKVLTIHDLTPILFPKLHTRETNLTWQTSLKLIKNQTNMIICDSVGTKNDCITHLNIPEKRLKVIPLAADEQYKPLKDINKIKEDLKREYDIDYPFILFVGTLEKRKNIPTLIKSFYKLKKSKLNHKLVIVGGKGWKYTQIFNIIKDLNLENDVIFTDYVSDENLVKLYNAADLFVYPSLYEGFGLPPLEAMACGCPVITSNTSSLPEVVGDAGIMVDPNNSNSLAESMIKILKNNQLKEDMGRKSLERASMFSWKKTAKETWDVYKEVLKL